jgi:hypothetical protein
VRDQSFLIDTHLRFEKLHSLRKDTFRRFDSQSQDAGKSEFVSQVNTLRNISLLLSKCRLSVTASLFLRDALNMKREWREEDESYDSLLAIGRHPLDGSDADF